MTARPTRKIVDAVVIEETPDKTPAPSGKAGEVAGKVGAGLTAASKIFSEISHIASMVGGQKQAAAAQKVAAGAAVLGETAERVVPALDEAEQAARSAGRRALSALDTGLDSLERVGVKIDPASSLLRTRKAR